MARAYADSADAALDLKADVAAEVHAEFRQFFRAHCPYVARIAHTILGASDEVDDVLQDVFLLAHRKADRLRDPRAVKGWLATIAVREARRRLRKRTLRAVVGLGDDVATWEAPADASVEPDQAMRARALARGLARLPVQERIPWTLRMEGYTAQEVADMCECSLATAKRRIAAAQAKLERILGHA